MSRLASHRSVTFCLRPDRSGWLHPIIAVTNRPRLDVYQIEPWVLAWEPVEAVAPAAASTATPALHMPVAEIIIP
jgi:hypothetical protein